jgi:hypothetical protein
MDAIAEPWCAQSDLKRAIQMEMENPMGRLLVEAKSAMDRPWSRTTIPRGASWCLATNKNNVQELPTAVGGRFARNQDHTISLFIQRAGLGAGLGFHGFCNHKFRGAFFLDYA